MSITKEIADQLSSPSPVVTTGLAVSTVNIVVANLPTIINVATAIYLVLAITHKVWQMYKEWKTNAPSK
jgi:hypothetical protein